jgi:hypothetical protein
MAIATPLPAARVSRTGISPEVAAGALDERLRTTRRRVLRQRLAVGAFLLAAEIGLWLGAVAAADYYLELAIAWRAAALLLNMACAIAAGVWAYRRWIAPYSLGRRGCGGTSGPLRAAAADLARLPATISPAGPGFPSAFGLLARRDTSGFRGGQLA